MYKKPRSGDEKCPHSNGPEQESRVMHAKGESSATHTNVLEQSEVHHLVLTTLVVELRRRFLFVRLDTANIVRLLQTSGHSVGSSSQHRRRHVNDKVKG